MKIVNSNKGIGIVGLMLILIILVLISLATSVPHKSDPPVPKTPEEIAHDQYISDDTDARSYAKIYIKNSLKAPSTAKFQSSADFLCGMSEDKNGKEIKDTWNVSGYVDAQNSFGAMIRSRWFVQMKKVGEVWIPQKIVIQ